MGLADGTVGDEDEDLGSEKSIAISALRVRTLLFIGIGLVAQRNVPPVLPASLPNIVSLVTL